MNEIEQEENKNPENTHSKLYQYVENSSNKEENHQPDAIRRSNGDMNPNDLELNNNNNINHEEIPLRVSHISLIIPDDSILHWMFCFIVGGLEILMIIFLACLFKWDIRNDPKFSFKQDNILYSEINQETENELNEYYGIFRDINIMVFVGYGMMHTLIKNYSWGSVVVNILSIAFSAQFGLIMNLIWENSFRESWKKGVLNFQSLIQALFNACAVEVSLGSLMGRLSLIQYLILIIFENIFVSFNFKLCDSKLKSIDVGGALYVHTFGTVFGLAIYMVLFCSERKREKFSKINFLRVGDYFSHLTSFIGIIFIFCYLPSFNTGLTMNNNSRYRALLNTYLSLGGSVISSFATSSLFNSGRLILEEIMFGCLSGGVIISGCCSVCIDKWAAILIGFLCGFITIALLHFVKPFLASYGFQDIFNTVSLHGIPGILGAFITPMMIGDLHRRIKKPHDYHFIFLSDMERDNQIQAGVQLGAIFITFGIAFVSGIAVGYLMKISTCGKIEEHLNDSEFFANDENVHPFFKNQINNDINEENIGQPSFLEEHHDEERRDSDYLNRGEQPSINNNL